MEIINNNEMSSNVILKINKNINKLNNIDFKNNGKGCLFYDKQVYNYIPIIYSEYESDKVKQEYCLIEDNYQNATGDSGKALFINSKYRSCYSTFIPINLYGAYKCGLSFYHKGGREQINDTVFKIYQLDIFENTYNIKELTECSYIYTSSYGVDITENKIIYTKNNDSQNCGILVVALNSMDYYYDAENTSESFCLYSQNITKKYNKISNKWYNKQLLTSPISQTVSQVGQIGYNNSNIYVGIKDTEWYQVY